MHKSSLSWPVQISCISILGIAGLMARRLKYLGGFFLRLEVSLDLKSVIIRGIERLRLGDTLKNFMT